MNTPAAAEKRRGKNGFAAEAKAAAAKDAIALPRAGQKGRAAQVLKSVGGNAGRRIWRDCG
jgi:hypothetical protein